MMLIRASFQRNMSTTVVQKYGGTSLGTAERLEKVTNIIKQFHKPGQETVVAVVSALSSDTKAEGTTSRLLAAAEAAVNQKDFQVFLDRIEDTHMDALYGILKSRNGREETRQFIQKELGAVREFCHALGVIRELSPRSHDLIIGCGERLSAGLLAGILKDQGLDAKYVDLSRLFVQDLNTHKRGYQKQAREALRSVLQPLVAQGSLPVVTGFFGNVKGGIIHGVGRGYTDLTSALVAGALGSRTLQVWKESDGVFTGNPTKIKDASLVGLITPAEAAELTAFGNEVLHPFTMTCAIESNVPIQILNTFKPDSNGTTISDPPTSDNNKNSAPINIDPEILKSRVSKFGIVAVCSKKNVPVLNLVGNGVLDGPEFFKQLFECMNRYQIKADIVTSSISQVSIALHETTPMAALDSLLKDLEEFSVPKVKTERAIVSCVGEGMAHQVGLAAKLFSCLAENGISIEMMAQGASELNMSVVIPQKDEEKAIKAIHETFLKK
jgi:aspartate kinase